MVIQYLSKPFAKIFGSRNERIVKRYFRRVEQINALEPQMRALTDLELRSKTEQFIGQLSDGQQIGELMPEIQAVAREVMDRAVGIRNIFNPDHSFDSLLLPTDLQSTYDRIREQVGTLEPQPVLGGDPVPGWMQVEIPLQLYDAVRQLFPQSRPPFRARPFDVQLIGGTVLCEGKIAEMKTGEGKTIVAPLACYVACIEGMQCHIVTVNDYLVQRDRDWVFPFYYHLGLTVGAIHPFHQQPPQLKTEAYQCNVVYGTNSEFGFDYLRDNMKLASDEQVQKQRDFCIVDEVDSILIDEARTPLIISGPAHDDAPRYGMADGVARHLMQQQRDWDAANRKVIDSQMRLKGLEGDGRNSRDKAKAQKLREQAKELAEHLPQLEVERDRYTQYYEVEMERKAAHLTHDGVALAQKQAGIGSFYVGNNMDFPHLLENALRAHAVYKRDKDYVVQEGEVVIVDEFTGRLMVGRQWSNGLHQAIEAKERVKIKEETQTLATVTIQNFFKLYGRLAGMTGTAITEATEFNEIYNLDVICMPTNVVIQRIDRDDLIFLSEKDKWNAILDEIKRLHDLGRPVLVGTTSVERSEMLSKMLINKHGIKHEVLNARVDQAEREAGIVDGAGELGAVMIATNMAGRGTDIRLRPIDRMTLVRHWQQRNLLPKQAAPQMSDEQLQQLAYVHMAQVELGLKSKEAQEIDSDQLCLRLLRHWVEQDAFVLAEKARSMTRVQCEDELDKLPEYGRHRLEIWNHTMDMGGLHIVGTERHESRRIDNQLRGRSGRQGDKGSSRFFISLEDDLMKMFAGKATMTALSKLGMKEGDAIEHRWVTKSVERAQRKVEERNFEIRKNLLEYDEVMEYQRNMFYGIRQQCLEGRNISELIFDYIDEAIKDAISTYLARDYVPTQVAEWSRQTLEVSVDPSKVRLDDLDDLQVIVRNAAKDEVVQVIDVTLGEYMSNDLPAEEWDLRGLSQWAMSRFSVDLKANRLRTMNFDEVSQLLTEAAIDQIERKDLSGVEKFLDPHFGERDLSLWARNKFGIELKPVELAELEPRQVADQILGQARKAYALREITYPVDFIMELVFNAAQQDQSWAINRLIVWVKGRFDLDWTPEQITNKNPAQIHQQLVQESEGWLSEGGKLDQFAADLISRHGSDDAAVANAFTERFGRELEPEDLTGVEDRSSILVQRGREVLRSELTQLERFVLLQILDMAWKDHLYAMDQLKDSVGLRGYAERDPRIEYKREGASQFVQMQKAVRDRVTELIFRARLTPEVQARSVYGGQQAEHAAAKSTVSAATQEGQGQPDGAAMRAASQGTDQQRADLEAADRAGNHSEQFSSRRQRRAAKARQRQQPGSGRKERKRRSR